VVAAAVADGCAGTTTPTPGSSGGPAASATPAPTARASPSATATPTPSRPATPVPTPAPPRYVVAEFFYWYDSVTGAHMNRDDPLSLHPPARLPFGWREPDWFERELGDMIEVGVDIAACGYWPGERWSSAGLANLVVALERLVADGREPPKVAMFYETAPMAGLDLRRTRDLATFYRPIHDFHAAVPDRFWARIDGRPVIWFYDVASPAIRRDQDALDGLRFTFEAEFGERPYLVLDRSWVEDDSVTGDATYTWGVAFRGFQPRDSVAGAGPGYDDHLLPSRRGREIIVPRDEGAWYRRHLYYALASGRDILWLETWNEHHEATNINETREYGRTYLDITRDYIAMFKRRMVPSRPAGGPYAAATSVDAVLAGSRGTWEGLRMLESPGDGRWKALEVAGSAARTTTGKEPGRYLYFDIDDDFAYFDAPVTVSIEVEFLDRGGGTLVLDYDDYVPGAPDRLYDHYRPVELAAIGETGIWRTAEITLCDVRFANGQNAGADFRVWAGEGRDLVVRAVSVTKSS